jgi:flagellar motility protein MotE (MotC chaperone)
MKKIIFWLLLVVVTTVPAVFAEDDSFIDEAKISSVEERRILVSIEDEYAKLDEREAEIETKEMQLKTLEDEVDKKLAAMQQLRTELLALLERKDQVEGERISELSLIYEKMTPQKAGALIKELDEQLAVEVLLGIKKKTAGKILDSLDELTATKLSKAFTEIPVDE